MRGGMAFWFWLFWALQGGKRDAGQAALPGDESCRSLLARAGPALVFARIGSGAPSRPLGPNAGLFACPLGSGFPRTGEQHRSLPSCRGLQCSPFVLRGATLFAGPRGCTRPALSFSPLSAREGPWFPGFAVVLAATPALSRLGWREVRAGFSGFAFHRRSKRIWTAAPRFANPAGSWRGGRESRRASTRGGSAVSFRRSFPGWRECDPSLAWTTPRQGASPRRSRLPGAPFWSRCSFPYRQEQRPYCRQILRSCRQALSSQRSRRSFGAVGFAYPAPV